ncbi:MAG: hypothetical protein LRY66_05825 [Saccharospirillaceae bacterium]|nr:hypothetical protein [Saccharospirillaceae bacterium]MCD8530873.1 hypothetical protein [Saccharospirillaceae bacterium]
MRPVTEKHSGRCGHCKTAVPIDATVCTGCGAVWGLSNNLSREETYDAAIGAYNFLKYLVIIVTLVNAIIILMGGYKWLIFSIPLNLFSLPAFLSYYLAIRASKNGKVLWYRMLKQN